MSRKIAVVTGANKGLGHAIVKGLCAQYDGTVYLTSRDEKRGKDACEELKKIGLNPEYHQLDVTDEESIAKFRDFIKENKLEIDVLVNNAGVLFLKDAKEPKVYQAEQTIKVNFFALVNFNEAMLPFVKNGGRIINISSSSGHLSRIPSKDLRKKLSAVDLSLEELKDLMSSYVDAVRFGQDIDKGWGESPYVVSKNGVNAYTFMLHRNLADKGVIVTAYHPGYVKSDMTRGAGSATPEQGARLALKLAMEPCAGGRYVWHDGTPVSWDGPDPRDWLH